MIENQALENISSAEVIESYVSQILEIMHQAFSCDNKRFITEILYGHTLTIRPLQVVQDYVFEDFAELRKGAWNERTQRRLADNYLQLIANLFEPYLSILVASVQLINKKFTTFVAANLHASERNKWEYLTAKLHSADLFIGYDPVIRNAVAHAGSHGVTCKPGSVLFRNIDRTAIPTVKDQVELSNEQLVDKIISVIDFTQSIDVAVNIFGLDVSEVIGTDDELKRAFYERVMRPENRNALKERAYKDYLTVWNNYQMSELEKLEHFARLFTESCEASDMFPNTLVFHPKSPDILVIKVNHQPIDPNDKDQLIKRAVELIRFAVICEPFFRVKHKSFLVEEETETGHSGMQAYIQGDELRAYNLEKVSMYDLLQDGNVYRNKVKVPIIVDFEEVDKLESNDLVPYRPRKKR